VFSAVVEGLPSGQCYTARQRTILHEINDLMSRYPDAVYLKGAWQPHQFCPDTGAEVAFAGRSNAGKSSAINALVNRTGFARVSKSPGRTQLINFFHLRGAGNGEHRLVDLPGYGFARVAPKMQQHWRDLIGAYFAARQSLAGLFVIVDIRRGLGDYDRQMLDWATRLDCSAHVLLTKADKLKRGAAQTALLGVRRDLGHRAGAQLFSATKRIGVEEATEVLDTMLMRGSPDRDA
jgi:GTP-binding protein